MVIELEFLLDRDTPFVYKRLNIFCVVHGVKRYPSSGGEALPDIVLVLTDKQYTELPGLFHLEPFDQREIFLCLTRPPGANEVE